MKLISNGLSTALILILLLWPLTMVARPTRQPRSFKASEITGRVDLLRISARNGLLTVSELFVLDENISESKTTSEVPFTIRIPVNATIQQSIAENSSGEPTTVSASRVNDGLDIQLQLPIHTGGTKVQIIYEVPYSGSLNFEVLPSVPQQMLAVMLPKSMQFESAPGEFQLVESDQPVNVYVVKQAPAFRSFRFHLRGFGDLPSQTDAAGEKSPVSSPANAKPARTDGSSVTRWLIAAGALLLGGGFLVWRRRRASIGKSEQLVGDPRVEQLREELFALETARLKNAIDPDDYKKRQAELRSRIKRLQKS